MARESGKKLCFELICLGCKCLTSPSSTSIAASVMIVITVGGGRVTAILALACMLSCFSCVQLFVTLWTIAPQAPLSMGSFRQEYWSGLPCPPPGDLPNPRIKPLLLCLLHWQAGSSDINHSKIVYDTPPRVMEIKTKINKWGLIKLKSFFIKKKTISKVKRQPSEWEKIVANETTDKELISKIYK